MCLLRSKILVKTRHVSVNIVTIFRGCIYSSFYSYFARHVYASSIYWLCGNILSIYVLLCRTYLCHVRLRTQPNMNICMYLCMYVCVNECMYVCMYVCVCIYIYVCT